LLLVAAFGIFITPIFGCNTLFCISPADGLFVIKQSKSGDAVHSPLEPKETVESVYRIGLNKRIFYHNTGAGWLPTQSRILTAHLGAETTLLKGVGEASETTCSASETVES
jgi:hypothetical protein